MLNYQNPDQAIPTGTIEQNNWHVGQSNFVFNEMDKPVFNDNGAQYMLKNDVLVATVSIEMAFDYPSDKSNESIMEHLENNKLPSTYKEDSMELLSIDKTNDDKHVKIKIELEFAYDFDSNTLPDVDQDEFIAMRVQNEDLPSGYVENSFDFSDEDIKLVQYVNSQSQSNYPNTYTWTYTDKDADGNMTMTDVHTQDFNLEDANKRLSDGDADGSITYKYAPSKEEFEKYNHGYVLTAIDGSDSEIILSSINMAIDKNYNATRLDIINGSMPVTNIVDLSDEILNMLSEQDKKAMQSLIGKYENDITIGWLQANQSSVDDMLLEFHSLIDDDNGFNYSKDNFLDWVFDEYMSQGPSTSSKNTI
jgi:hypothetical protein